ncbi:MAG: redoxin domain-containing protein [Candidatus Omnitrophica bacterium]|nr:redoxin domain-containing protein [Candidatus Omnitrophota bacterium]
MKNFLRVSVLILILLSFFTNVSAMGQQYKSASDTNKAAPDFSLLDTERNEVSLSDLKGAKNIVLFFWTTWCPHCRRQIKYLNNIYAELKENNTEILAIDIQENLSTINKFVADYPVEFRILLDKDASVAEDYDILGVPTYIIINKQGNISLISHSFPDDYKKFISD